VSTPPPLDAAPEQRLHPWSWLFVLLMQLRQGLVPLIALVVFGQRGDRDELWLSLGPVIAVVVLVAYSVLQYLTYRYRIGTTAITVRSGVFARNRREIPFARIHNVVVHRAEAGIGRWQSPRSGNAGAQARPGPRAGAAGAPARPGRPGHGRR